MAMNARKFKQVIKENSVIFILIAVVVSMQVQTYFTFGTPALLVPSNVADIILQNTYVLLLTLGMLLCIVAGGNIDLSIGSIACLSGAIAGRLMMDLNLSIPLTIVVCLLCGICIGFIHGILIAYAQLPSVIVTLAGMWTWQNIAIVILDGRTISPLPQQYLRLFTGQLPDMFLPKLASRANSELVPGQATEQLRKVRLIFTAFIAIAICVLVIIIAISRRNMKKRIGIIVEETFVFVIRYTFIIMAILWLGWELGNYIGIPMPLILASFFAYLYHFFLKNMAIGRHIYAMGGNKHAARLAGVNIGSITMMTYVNMGFLAALSSLVWIARFNLIAPLVGQGYEIDVIASCLIGGVSIYGGSGSVGGAVVGAVFIAILNNTLLLFDVPLAFQGALKGIVLLLALLANAFLVRQKRR